MPAAFVGSPDQTIVSWAWQQLPTRQLRRNAFWSFCQGIPCVHCTFVMHTYIHTPYFLDLSPSVAQERYTHRNLTYNSLFRVFIIWPVVGRPVTCRWVVDLAAIYSQRQVIISHCEDRWLTHANDMATTMTDSGTGPCKYVMVIVSFSTPKQSLSALSASL